MKQLRAWHIANGEMVHQVEVENIQEAITLIDKWTEEDMNNPFVEFNAFGCEEYSEEAIDGEHWTEWYDEDGYDIIQIMDGENE